MSHEYRPGSKDWYDYEKQAWVQGGAYVRCGHVGPCYCYGRAHEGERADGLTSAERVRSAERHVGRSPSDW